MVRGLKFTTDVELEIEECFKCGGVFAMTAKRLARMQDIGGNAYCPYCANSWVYKETELQKAERKAKRAENKLAAERAAHDQTKASLRAQKGVTTRLKNRASKGVCPCCHRYFKNLHRHMKGQHPDFEAEPCESESTS